MDKLSYSVKEAAEVVGLGKTKLYELINSQTIPTVRIGGRTLIRRCDLEDLLQRNLAA